MPRINVLMSVYNQELFLAESIESILNQTFSDFELLVVNDGSVDKSLEILHSYKDSRIRILDNNGNKGLIYSLNAGLDNISDCEYVVRMDSDDIALPSKFQKQVDFLSENPKIGLLGTGINFFGDGLKETKFLYPETHKKIVSTFLYFNPFAHPTVMIRRSQITPNFRYDFNFPKYEDYALWITMINECQFHNLNDTLLMYRRHASNVTNSYKQNIHVTHAKVLSLLKLYRDVTGIKLSDTELDVVGVITNRDRFEINPSIAVEELVGVVRNLSANSDLEFLDIIYMKQLLIRYVIVYLLSLKRKADAFKFVKTLGITKDIFKVGSSLLLSKSLV